MTRIQLLSSLFTKKLLKLKRKEFSNIDKKVQEIRNVSDLDNYKNLKNVLKKYKRVHVNNNYIILFFGDDETVYSVDYEDHDTVYKPSKKLIEKYEKLKYK
jgi:plasmid maintenance system killer protein